MSKEWFSSEMVEQRVEALLGKMTLQEKIDLVSGKLVVDDSGRFPPLPDGFPELLLADGAAGLRIMNPEINDRKATALPAPIALAATWDPELAREYGHLLGAEAAATGHNVLLAPAVDIARAPLAGRTSESFGEDPLLQARMVAPEIQAIQSHAVLACIKHYLVNNQEFQRNTIDVQVEERTLREIYLPPFVAALQEGYVGSLMGSYNRINGSYACENEFILTEVLREELGFRGFVMSDFMATQSTVQSAQAGLDWELGTRMWGSQLLQAVELGEVSQELLDEMARRIIRPILGLGLADRPRKSGSLNLEEHSVRARAIAEQGIVLLKNEKQTLPLVQNKIRSIAVIGPDADNVSAACAGAASVRPSQEISVLDGIRRSVGELIWVEYAAGTDPVGPGTLLLGYAAIPSSFFPQGIQAEYWDNPTFTGEPSVVRVEPSVEINFGFADFFAGLRSAGSKILHKPMGLPGRISARYSGPLSIPASGEYVLSVTCIGTARLYLNEQLILDTSNSVSETTLGNSPASLYVVRIHLDAADSCSLRVDYANDPGELRFGEAMLRLGWMPPAGVTSPAIRHAAELAKKSDAVILVARTYETEEIDRPSIQLPNGQDELIRAVASANPNTVVVLMNAGPVEVVSWEADVPAILEAWYAGQEQGRAVASILFGDVNPSGRLPITFPRTLEQTPVSSPAQYPGIDDKVYYSEGLSVGYRGYDQLGFEPQYPFGYGLSYTTFEYGNLTVDAQKTDGIQKIEVSFEIANIGNRDGIEVAQLYIRLPASASPPLKRLVGWERIALKSGERKQVSVTIDPCSSERPLSFWNIATQSWEIADGDYMIYLAASARDIKHTAGFKLQTIREKLQ